METIDIQKVGVTPLPEDITASIVNSKNIEDKAHNTYSAEIIDGLVKDVYSTTETVVGIFLDKLLYRKVYVIDSETSIPSNKVYQVAHQISNLSEIIDARAKLIGFDNQYIKNGSSMMAPRITPDGLATYSIGVDIGNPETVNLQFGTAYTKFKNLRLTVEYTKTTD